MIEDILIIAKYTVLFICSFYGFIKLTKIKLNLLNLLDLLVTVVLAIALHFATKNLKMLVPVGFLLLTFLYCLRFRRPVLTTTTISVISCGITIITMVIAFVVSIPFEFLTFAFIPNAVLRDVITLILVCVLMLVIIFLTYRIKRLKSGISIQSNTGTIEILLLISILSIFLMTLFYTDNIANSPLELIVLALLFCGLAFIIWWKKHVTNNYQKQVYKRNEIIYERRIEEYEQKQKKLLNQNDELSKIIHRDNKLIPAMASAVEKLIENSPDKKEFEDLLNQLKSLSEERNRVIDEYQAKTDSLPKTGNSLLDAVLHFLNSNAKQNKIAAEFKIDDGAIPAALQVVKDPVDLNTMICDLGENAVIATKHTENGKIFIAFEINNGIASISFYDNGPPFDKSVIENMGKKRITTHKNEGGSGIGLMT
ncbi:MAG: hypothetical protein K2J83_03970, partial [Clostridia bacterium]|nr:hypothetical protein [Clostridia bacterium]